MQLAGVLASLFCQMGQRPTSYSGCGYNSALLPEWDWRSQFRQLLNFPKQAFQLGGASSHAPQQVGLWLSSSA